MERLRPWLVVTGAWMTARHARWAYDCDDPRQAAVSRDPGAPSITHLVATGRERTTPSGLWREFRRVPRDEFETVYAAWER